MILLIVSKWYHGECQIDTTNTNVYTMNTNNKKERKKTTSYDEIINELIKYEEVKELIYEFIKMRNLKKKPLTDRALKIQINKLNRLTDDPKEQIEILETSIVRNWDELYPLKEKEKKLR